MNRAKEQRVKLLKERSRRRQLPINTYQPDSTPDRDQLTFHRSQARYRLCFGGNRSGKSTCTAYEVAAWARNCHKFQPISPGPKEIYVVSAEYRTLYQGIHRHIMPNRVGMRFLDPTWIKREGPKIPGATVPLPGFIEVYCEFDESGQRVDPESKDRPFSTIWFISGDGGEQARKKLQAAAIHLCVIDEEVEYTLFEEIEARLLDYGGRLCISATLVRSEEWLMDLEDQADSGQPAVSIVRLNTETSAHLDEEAKREILGRWSDEARAVRVEGKSRRQFGLVYPDFGVDHVFSMADRFPEGFPSSFVKLACTDPGFRVHAGLWCAVDLSTSTAYFYREMYEKEATLREVAEFIAESEGYRLEPVSQAGPTLIYKRRPIAQYPEEIEARLIDPEAMRNMEDGRIGIATQMAAYFDMPVIPANNDLEAGVEAVRLMLGTNPATGEPHFLFDVNLRNFFSERRRYRLRQDTGSRNTHETKAEPLRRHNHLMDAWRYLTMWIMNMVGRQTETNRHSGKFNYALDVPAATGMAERMEEHAKRIRGNNNHESSVAGANLGAEW